MSSWYYADANNSRQGPVEGTDLVRWLGEGRLRWETLVWREGMGDWQPMSAFADEFTALAATAAPVASPAADVVRPSAADNAMSNHVSPTTPASDSAARDSWTTAPLATPAADTRAAAPAPSSAPADDTRWSQATPAAAARSDSPYAAPNAPLLQAAGVYQGNEVVYAGFWKRVAAYVVDGLIVGIAGAIVGAVIGGVMGAGLGMRSGGLEGGGLVAIQLVSQVVSLAMTAAYFAFFHASRGQATPGKLAIGIKVTRADGSPISVARGVGRYFGLLLSSLILGIGLIMAGVTERKQALHDLMSDTLVVDKWAFTESPQLQRHELGTITVVILVLGGLLAVGTIVAVAVGLMALGGALGR